MTLTTDDVLTVEMGLRVRALELSSVPRLDADTLDAIFFGLDPAPLIPAFEFQVSGGRYAYDIVLAGFPLLAISPRMQELPQIQSAVERGDIALRDFSTVGDKKALVRGYRILAVVARATVTELPGSEFANRYPPGETVHVPANSSVFMINDTHLVGVTKEVALAIARERLTNVSLLPLTESHHAFDPEPRYFYMDASPSVFRESEWLRDVRRHGRKL